MASRVTSLGVDTDLILRPLPFSCSGRNSIETLFSSPMTPLEALRRRGILMTTWVVVSLASIVSMGDVGRFQPALRSALMSFATFPSILTCWMDLSSSGAALFASFLAASCCVLASIAPDASLTSSSARDRGGAVATWALRFTCGALAECESFSSCTGVREVDLLWPVTPPIGTCRSGKAVSGAECRLLGEAAWPHAVPAATLAPFRSRVSAAEVWPSLSSSGIDSRECMDTMEWRDFPPAARLGGDTLLWARRASGGGEMCEEKVEEALKGGEDGGTSFGNTDCFRAASGEGGVTVVRARRTGGGDAGAFTQGSDAWCLTEDGDGGGVASFSPSGAPEGPVDEATAPTGEREPARLPAAAGFVLILGLCAFRAGVGDEDNRPAVPMRGPGGVRRPEGEIGRAGARLERLEVELEGVDSMEARPSGETGRSGTPPPPPPPAHPGKPGEAGGVTTTGEGEGEEVSSRSVVTTSGTKAPAGGDAGAAKGPFGERVPRGFRGGFVVAAVLSERHDPRYDP